MLQLLVIGVSGQASKGSQRYAESEIKCWFFFSLIDLLRVATKAPLYRKKNNMPLGRMDVDALPGIAWLLWLRRRKRRRQRLWVYEINAWRLEFGSFRHLFPDLAKNPDFCRMTTDHFRMLVELMHSLIMKIWSIEEIITETLLCCVIISILSCY